MWPKALLQLLELVPHVSRLLPVADKFLQGTFLQSKSTLDDATLKTIGELRGELGQANASHAGLYRQMNEQSEKLANVLEEVRGLRSSALVQQAELAELQGKMASQKIVLAVCAAFSVVSAVGVVMLLLRH